MINKKNVLGKRPQEFGVKDAVHVAIVSVHAGRPIQPGQRVGQRREIMFRRLASGSHTSIPLVILETHAKYSDVVQESADDDDF